MDATLEHSVLSQVEHLVAQRFEEGGRVSDVDVDRVRGGTELVGESHFVETDVRLREVVNLEAQFS